MSPRAILSVARELKILPTHIYGKTVHKTLQARISEDIAIKGERSRFFRSEPGKFFLRSLVGDESVPVAYKEEYFARPRARDLRNFEVVTTSATKNFHYRGLAHQCFESVKFDEASRRDDVATLVAFSVVYRNGSVLTHSVPHDSTSRCKSACKALGFGYPITPDDADLFSEDYFGADNAAVNGLSRDFGFDPMFVTKYFDVQLSDEGEAGVCESPDFGKMRPVLIFFRAPADFNPLKRRLALKDLHWWDLNRIPNDLSELEGASKTLFNQIIRVVLSR